MNEYTRTSMYVYIIYIYIYIYIYIFIRVFYIYLLISVVLTPGGSITVHIYTQTAHSTTQTEYPERNIHNSKDTQTYQ
jgi:hypothetical protein